MPILPAGPMPHRFDQSDRSDECCNHLFGDVLAVDGAREAGLLWSETGPWPAADRASRIPLADRDGRRERVGADALALIEPATGTMLAPSPACAGDPLSRDFDRPVIVAVTLVRMVQPPVHEEVHMAAVRDSLVTTPGSMRMAGTVGRLATAVRVGLVDPDHMLVDVVLVWMMQVPVVQVVDMALMAQCGVSTTRAVSMVVRSCVGHVHVVAHGAHRIVVQAPVKKRVMRLAITTPSRPIAEARRKPPCRRRVRSPRRSGRREPPRDP